MFMRIVKTLDGYTLRFLEGDEILLDVPAPDAWKLKGTTGVIFSMTAVDDHRVIRIGQRIAFFDKEEGIVMISPVKSIYRSDMINGAMVVEVPYSLELGLADNRFVYTVEAYDFSVSGGCIMTNTRDIAAAVDKLLPELLP